MGGVLAGVVTLIMALGAVFAALNSMYAAVAARGKEIATLRAIGYGPALGVHDDTTSGRRANAAGLRAPTPTGEDRHAGTPRMAKIVRDSVGFSPVAVVPLLRS